jgi:hypothetical protein
LRARAEHAHAALSLAVEHGMSRVLLPVVSGARGEGVNEGPFMMDYAALKAKIEGESESLRRSTSRWLWGARILWVISLFANVYVFSQNIALGGSFHGLLAGVNATMISVCVFGIMWTTVLWPYPTRTTK